MPGLFPPFDLPDGVILLITDQLAAPADFVLHRTLAIHLRERRKPCSLILSVSEGFGRWKALAAKSVRLVRLITHYLNLLCLRT